MANSLHIKQPLSTIRTYLNRAPLVRVYDSPDTTEKGVHVLWYSFAQVSDNLDKVTRTLHQLKFLILLILVALVVRVVVGVVMDCVRLAAPKGVRYGVRDEGTLGSFRPFIRTLIWSWLIPLRLALLV